MLPLYSLNNHPSPNYSTLSTKRTTHHKCLNCGLVFQSSFELLNHNSKFCTNSGFDTIAGLNLKLKNPLTTKEKLPKRQLNNDSLTNALEQVQRNRAFVPREKQFLNDVERFQRDLEQVGYARPYLHGSSKKTLQVKNTGRQSRSLHMSINEYEQRQNEGYHNNNYKHRNLSINHAHEQPSRSKAYSLTESHIKKFKQSQTYISPPSHLPQLQNAKQFSLFDRSDMSIRNMPEQQKRQYVVRKILELEGIQEAYKKNGGKSQGFMENTRKMIRFYQDLLKDVNERKNDRFGKISNGTRVSTPISKLEQLNISNVSLESTNNRREANNRQNQQNLKPHGVKSRLGEIQQKSMAKRQEQIRKRFNTQFPEAPKQQQHAYDILENDILSKLKSQGYNKQPPVIVIPIQQPTPMHPINYQTNSNNQTELMMKYLESVNAMKQEQNGQYLSLLQRQNQEMKRMYEESMKSKEKQFGQNQNKIKALENNYNKLLDKFEKLKDRETQAKYQQNVQLEKERYVEQSFPYEGMQQNFKKNKKQSHPRQHLRTQYSSSQDKQYRQLHPQLQNIRLLNIQQPGFHIQSAYNMLSQEQKILMQMQHEQRDQFQLFSHLPSEIQQLKLQSLKQTGEKRFEMQKEVLSQKLEKLKIMETMKQFQLERKLLTEELQNEKKKIQIHKLMKKKIKNMVKEHFDDTKTDQDQIDSINPDDQSLIQSSHLDPFDPENK